MFVPSHIASGFLLGKGVLSSIYKNKHAPYFLLMVTIGAVIPDVDGIFSDTVAGHHSVLHTPILWIGFYTLAIIMSKMFNRKNIQPLGLGVMLGAQLHLFTDWFTARTVGIQWLYPFSHKDFFLYPIQPEQGQVTVWEMMKDPYFSFYLENGFLFCTEIIICLSALIIAIRSKNRM